jgi:hypothetical protein
MYSREYEMLTEKYAAERREDIVKINIWEFLLHPQSEICMVYVTSFIGTTL